MKLQVENHIITILNGLGQTIDFTLGPDLLSALLTTEIGAAIPDGIYQIKPLGHAGILGWGLLQEISELSDAESEAESEIPQGSAQQLSQITLSSLVTPNNAAHIAFLHQIAFLDVSPEIDSHTSHTHNTLLPADTYSITSFAGNPAHGESTVPYFEGDRCIESVKTPWKECTLQGTNPEHRVKFSFPDNTEYHVSLFELFNHYTMPQASSSSSSSSSSSDSSSSSTELPSMTSDHDVAPSSLSSSSSSSSEPYDSTLADTMEMAPPTHAPSPNTLMPFSSGVSQSHSSDSLSSSDDFPSYASSPASHSAQHYIDNSAQPNPCMSLMGGFAFVGIIILAAGLLLPPMLNNDGGSNLM